MDTFFLVLQNMIYRLTAEECCSDPFGVHLVRCVWRVVGSKVSPLCSSPHTCINLGCIDFSFRLGMSTYTTRKLAPRAWWHFRLRYQFERTLYTAYYLPWRTDTRDANLLGSVGFGAQSRHL